MDQLVSLRASADLVGAIGAFAQANGLSASAGMRLLLRDALRTRGFLSEPVRSFAAATHVKDMERVIDRLLERSGLRDAAELSAMIAAEAAGDRFNQLRARPDAAVRSEDNHKGG